MYEIATFKDFNFKLAVIQVLMYEQGLLVPLFDVYEFAEEYDERQIDVEAEGHAIIPEVKRYFEKFDVPKSLLAGVEELYQDGGNEIYLQLCPFWDGEDESFDIETAVDLHLLPNLKKVTLFGGDEALLEAFRAKGVQAEWL